MQRITEVRDQPRLVASTDQPRFTETVQRTPPPPPGDPGALDFSDPDNLGLGIGVGVL